MASVVRAPLRTHNHVPSGTGDRNPAAARTGGDSAPESKVYKLPKLVVRAAGSSRNASKVTVTPGPFAAPKPAADSRKRKQASESVVAAAAPAAVAPTAAVPQREPAADAVVGPSEPAKAVAPPRPARVALPPAAVATELAEQRRQQAAAEAAEAAVLKRQPSARMQVPLAFALRCSDVCCPEPGRRLAADDVARQVGCTAGCVLRYHGGGCSHGGSLKAAWLCSGAPCPTPDCGGVTLYAAEMGGDAAFKAFKYGAKAKAAAEEAERQRKKRNAAMQQAAAKQQTQQRSGTVKKAAKPTAAPAAAAEPIAEKAVAHNAPAPAAEASRASRQQVDAMLVQRSGPVMVLQPRTPSPPVATHRSRRSAPPPLPQAARGRSPLGRVDPAAVDNVWLRRRAASAGTTAAEDDADELIDLAGRYATSCVSAEADIGENSCGEEAFALPSFLENGVSNTEAFWAAVDAQATAAAAARPWAVEPTATLRPAAVTFVPLKPLKQNVVAVADAEASPRALASASPVLRFGAAPHMQAMHKTELCSWWYTQGHCTRGDDCTFAHGTAELRKAPTRRCRYFNGPQGCFYGEACMYSHSTEDDC